MRTHRAYLFGVGLALPMVALVAGLQVPSVAASPQPAATDVNRSLKGDRLPAVTRGNPADRQGWQNPAAPPKIARWLRGHRQRDDAILPGTDAGTLHLLTGTAIAGRLRRTGGHACPVR